MSACNLKPVSVFIFLVLAPSPTHVTKIILSNLYFPWVLVSCQHSRALGEVAWGRNTKCD